MPGVWSVCWPLSMGVVAAGARHWGKVVWRRLPASPTSCAAVAIPPFCDRSCSAQTRRHDTSRAQPPDLVRILALDLGDKRIGVAVSQLGGSLALPDGVITRRNWSQVIAEIRARLDAVQADRIVVGLPLRMDGTEGPAALATRKFVQRLQSTVSVPVDVQDERLSTVEAERSLIAAEMRRRRRRAVRDAVAAAIMLQTYLDRRR